MVRFTFKKGLRFREGNRVWTLIRRMVTGKLQFEADDEDADADNDDQDVAEDNTVYIVEGGQICYGSKRAWETCRDS